jgi:uncharacterized protein DUF2272
MFWKNVQSTCDIAAAKPAGEVGRRIAQAAIDEFNRFGGHRIDSNGRLFRFGLTEAQHTREDGDQRPTSLGDLGWRRVATYWRALYGDGFADKLEVLGYRDASSATPDAQAAAPIRSTAGRLQHMADDASDPAERELLREAALRAAIVDTPWSAAFISYVVREAGVAAGAFQFANAHRAYIYEAFATSTAERAGTAGERLYRACPVATTRPRVGDILCEQREPALASLGEEAVRERIRSELGTDARSVRRTHCEVVAHIDAPARKLYAIGGNVLHAVAARKLNLRARDFKLSATQSSPCIGTRHWTLPEGAAAAPRAQSPDHNCSLNDKKWFVLLQVR